MKLKLRIVGIILVICVAISGAAVAFAATDAPKENGLLGDAKLHFSEIEVYDVNEAFFLGKEPNIVENREIYTDDEGNTYIFLNDEIIAYWLKDFAAYTESLPETPSINKDECLDVVSKALSSVIREYDGFCITSIDEVAGGYRVLMHNTIAEYVQDTLTVHVNGDGSIAWFVVDYSSLSSVADEQFKAANESFEKYISENEDVAIDYILKFRAKGEYTIATYIVTFEAKSGAHYCDAISFIV